VPGLPGEVVLETCGSSHVGYSTMMPFGNLVCYPISVKEVIERHDCDGQYMAIHGLLFYGDGCETNEFLLLPKDGPFTGVGPIPMPESLDRRECILIEEPALDSRLGGSSVSGLYRYKDDAVVIGRVRRHVASRHPVRVGELWLILMQDWMEMPRGSAFHELRVVAFPHSRLPKLPWNNGRRAGKLDLKGATMTEEDWRNCTDPRPMLEFLRGKANDRRQRLFGIAWCRNEWHLLSDERSRQAVEIAEKYAEGQATVDDLGAAYDAAFEAAYELDKAGLGPRRSSAHYSAGNVAARTVKVTAFPALEPTGVTSQIGIARDIFGNPFRPITLDPSWLTPSVVKLAHTIYDDCAFDCLPSLADALQDAGCHDAAILGHCRQPGPHYRGCWALDLILGKE